MKAGNVYFAKIKNKNLWVYLFLQRSANNISPYEPFIDKSVSVFVFADMKTPFFLQNKQSRNVKILWIQV